MDRYWLLTWTTYGTWLPGDERGFVGRERIEGGRARWRNVPGTPAREPAPALERVARAAARGPAVWLAPAQASAIVDAISEVVRYRGWELRAAAVMRNHVHIVLGVPGDPDPADLLGDCKRYASRALNRRGQRPASGTWWTRSGSRRVLKSDAAIHAATDYVRAQVGALAVVVSGDVSQA